jgi:hypothetical protein
MPMARMNYLNIPALKLSTRGSNDSQARVIFDPRKYRSGALDTEASSTNSPAINN